MQFRPKIIFKIMLNLHYISCKFVPKSNPKKNIFATTTENWCNKGASAKMHKCLVGFLPEDSRIIQTFDQRSLLLPFLHSLLCSFSKGVTMDHFFHKIGKNQIKQEFILFKRIIGIKMKFSFCGNCLFFANKIFVKVTKVWNI